MRAFRRWQLAVLLGLFALVPILFTMVGMVAYGGRQSLAFNLVSGFLVLLFAACFGLALSIGLDSELDDVPWKRVGAFAVFFALSFGVTWARSLL